MAKLVFLGRLEDLAGAPARDCPLAGPTVLADLLAKLAPALAEALGGGKVRLALNGTIVERAGLVVADGDELAFLPPVSGG
ncbi:MoaD/ThiS family protein [Novosphingobium bradum]|uniref:MoaD/ThiS family protein n=1 Tax=Novosphingobium bradum TaxID=1737444 RepID=A0ABV7IMT2_9SPHN